MKPLLSILIPTMPVRAKFLERLMTNLRSQCDDRVEILVEIDGGQMTTGHKRNLLNSKAKGLYVAHIDDDDLPSNDYMTKVLPLLNGETQVIGMRGIVTIDGVAETASYFTQSTKYKEWYSEGGHYFRPPTHLNPTLREIALEVPFLDISYKEDYAYSNSLLPLLDPEKEVYVPEPIYLYELRSNRSGKDKDKQ